MASETPPENGLHRATFGSADWQELLNKHFTGNLCTVA